MRIAGALLLLLLAPAAAQEGIAPALARGLAEARQKDQLSRILGDHRFTFTRSYFSPEGKETGQDQQEMVYRVGLADGRLTLGVDVLFESAPRPVEFRYELDAATGRLLKFDASFPDGRRFVSVLEGETLKISEAHQGAEPSSREEKVDPDAICPKQVGVFLLPMLHDLGVPERVSFRDLDPFGRIGAPSILRRAFATSGEVIFATDEGRAFPTTTVRVGLRGPQANRVAVFDTIQEVVKTSGGGDRVVQLARSVRQAGEGEKR